MIIREKAFAKLNLCLDVVGKLDDGYHELRGIMQSIDFCDDLEIIPGGDEWTCQCDLPYIPRGDTNLACRAAALFCSAAEAGPTGGEIRINKRIPVCAGFGGGSSDAAAVLRTLNREYGKPFDRSELERLALSLGVDVPFCVGGGTAIACGKGEKLTPLPFLSDCFVIVCKPDFACSTASLFAAIDKIKITMHPDVQGMAQAIKAGDIPAVARRLFNVFEQALPRRRAETVNELKNRLIDSGALGACMTGSGSGVFGIYASRAAAENALVSMREGGTDCRIAATAFSQL